MTENEILMRILERLGYSDQAQAIFNFDELNEWFDDIKNVKLFVERGILQALSPLAKIIDCDGCEERCFKEVDIIANEKNKTHIEARIICNERDDIGFINVDLNRLKQWQTSGALLAKTLTKILDLAVSPIKNDKNNDWALGLLGSKKTGYDSPILRIDQGIFFDIAGYPIRLAEILKFDNDKLLLDKNDIIKNYVGKPKKRPITDGYIPSTHNREKGKIKTHERNIKIFAEYEKRKKAEPNIYNNAIAVEISEMQQFKGISHSRILRIVNNFLKNKKL